MTERNFTKELLYSYYADMENGDDVESIDYRSLIHIMTEMMTRIERLEELFEENFTPPDISTIGSDLLDAFHNRAINAKKKND
jgi:hypothetical protein